LSLKKETGDDIGEAFLVLQAFVHSWKQFVDVTT